MNPPNNKIFYTIRCSECGLILGRTLTPFPHESLPPFLCEKCADSLANLSYALDSPYFPHSVYSTDITDTEQLDGYRLVDDGSFPPWAWNNNVYKWMCEILAMKRKK